MNAQQIKWIKTIIIYTCVFLTSFCLRSFFSTLLDFTEILNSSIEIVSFGLSVRCFGGCIGSILGGILFNYVDRLTVCAIFLMIGGISAATIPNVPYLLFYYMLKFMIGLTAGVTRTGVIVILTDVWGAKSRPFVQAYAFLQMVSAFVTPLLIHPFLSKNIRSGEEILADTEHAHNESAFDFEQDISDDIESEIWIPYGSLGFVMSVAAFIALSLQLWMATNSKTWSLNHGDLDKNENKENKLDKEDNSEEDNSEDRKLSIHWIIVFVCCSMIFVISALNIAFCQFWTTFVVYSDMDISKAKGNLMLSAFALAMGCGSLTNIFISIKLKPLKMLIILVTMMLFGNVIILCYGRCSETMLWIGGILVSAGVGPAVATIVNCLHERVKITNVIGSMTAFSVNLAHACGLPVLIGHFIQKQPQFLIHMNLCILVVIILLMMALRFIDSRPKSINFKREIE